MSRRTIIIASLLVLLAAVLWWRSGGKKDSKDQASSNVEAATGIAGGDDGEASTTTPQLPPTRLSGGGEAPNVAAAMVSGTVTDHESGEPVPWVDVIFKSRDGEAAVTSDESGRYETKLPAGQYELRAIGDGVIAKAMPTLRIGGTATVTRDVVVARLSTMRGQVVGPDGRGVAGVEILLRNDTRNGKAFPSEGEVGATMSLGDGSFEIEVPPGSVDLSASRDGTTVYASVDDVPSGGEVDGVRIVFDRRGRITGRVTLPGGSPAADADVMISYRREGTSSFESLETRTDSAGGFTFDGLAPTTYVVEAMLSGHASSAPTKTLLTNESLDAEVTLALNKPATLSGKVVDAEGRPVGNVQVAQVWAGSKQRFEKMETYADGEFSFRGVGPGPHYLRARKEGYADASLKDVMAPQEGLVLTLVANGGIEGTIVDGEGKPIQSFKVAVLGEKNKPVDTSSYRSRDGSFQMFPLAPGTYSVVITATGYGKKVLEAVEVPSGGYGDVSTTLAASK